MAEITITHTRANGTLIEGSSKGDGVYEILKSTRGNWRYFPSLRQIGIGQSRDRAAKAWDINQAAEALRAAGHVVTVEIDDTVARSFAEAEAERYDRADRRADYHAEKAGTAEGEAAARWQAERRILDGIPAGQPILVGHHSEGRHRRDLARADNHMRKGLEAIERRDYHENRTEAAEHYRAGRESIPVTLRRIEKIEAGERRIQRALAGRMDWVDDGNGGSKLTLVKPGDAYRTRLESELAAVQEQLAYWREHVKAAEEAGVKVWDKADFTKGDFVQTRFGYYEVLRVNAKSLSIPAIINDGPVVTKAGARCTWTDTLPYDKVKGRKSAEDMAGILAEAERREAQAAAS